MCYVNLTDVIAYICDGEVVCPDCYAETENGQEVEESPVFEADRDRIGNLYCPYCQTEI